MALEMVPSAANVLGGEVSQGTAKHTRKAV